MTKGSKKKKLGTKTSKNTHTHTHTNVQHEWASKVVNHKPGSTPTHYMQKFVSYVIYAQKMQKHVFGSRTDNFPCSSYTWTCRREPIRKAHAQRFFNFSTPAGLFSPPRLHKGRASLAHFLHLCLLVAVRNPEPTVKHLHCGVMNFLPTMETPALAERSDCVREG